MKPGPRRKLLIVGVFFAACSFGGGAYAATQDGSDSASPQAFLNDVAKRLGVTPQKLTAAFEGAATDQLNAAVKAGKLTQAQANAIEQRMRDHGAAPFGFLGPGPRELLAPGGFGPRGFGPDGFGPGGLLGPRGFFRFGPGGGPAPVLNAAAKYLGISTSALRSELRSEKTLQQIATEHGKSAAGLKQALRKAIRSSLPPFKLPRALPGPDSPPAGPYGPPAGLGGPPPPAPPAAS